MQESLLFFFVVQKFSNKCNQKKASLVVNFTGLQSICVEANAIPWLSDFPGFRRQD